MARLFLPLFTAAFLNAAGAPFVAADGLETFVYNKLSNFSTWIKTNNLDPSPPMIEAFHISNSGIVAAIETEISNLVIENHSEGSLEVDYVIAELSNGLFYAVFTIHSNISFSGHHQTNATILSSIPVTADGRFWINVTYIHPRGIGVEFTIGSNGYLNATRLIGGQFDLPTSGDAYFENLTDSEAAQGYEEYVSAAVYKGFQDWIIFDRGDPFRALFFKYWQSVLSESTLADIIGATDPPTTTITTTTPTWQTETIPPTTSQPCQNYGQGNHFTWQNDVEVLDEQVIETRKDIDKSGNPVIVKTRVIVTQEKDEL